MQEQLIETEEFLARKDELHSIFGSHEFILKYGESAAATCEWVALGLLIRPAWKAFAFSADDLQSNFNNRYFHSGVEHWQCDKEMVMKVLEENGIVKPFGHDIRGAKQYRMASATTGPLTDPCGQFAGYLEVIQEPTAVEDFRSFLIRNQDQLLG